MLRSSLIGLGLLVSVASCGSSRTDFGTTSDSGAADVMVELADEGVESDATDSGSDADLPLASAVHAVKVADFPGYTEGIVFDSSGTAYVSLLTLDVIDRVAPGGVPSPWASLSLPNGHAIEPDGTHVVAAKGAVYAIPPTGSPLTALAPTAGDALAWPNDVALDGNGGLYFTDPGTAVTDPSKRVGRVYYLDRDHVLHVAADDFGYCNGLVVRADGRVLFVDDSITSEIVAFDIVTPGKLEKRRTFATLSRSPVLPTGIALLDGMTLDASGRLYVAHYGAAVVDVLSREGELLRSYEVGIIASNVAFGGEGLGDLYVTGSPLGDDGTGVLYKLPLGIAGRGRSTLPAP